MLKRFFIATALVMASSPAFVSAQDFFFSFDENSATPTTTVANSAIGSTGSLFIFADAGLNFTILDLDFTNDNTSVVSFTGGVVFNPGAPNSGLADSTSGGSFTSFTLEDPTDVTPGVTPSDGRLFAVALLSPGALDPGDSNFRAEVPGFLLAQVDFNIVGAGTSNFSFILGDLGVQGGFGPTGIDVDVSATGSITVEDPAAIPEPTSTILLIFGAAAMVARRRRS